MGGMRIPIFPRLTPWLSPPRKLATWPIRNPPTGGWRITQGAVMLAAWEVTAVLPQ